MIVAMPSYTCRRPTCNAIIKTPGFCEKHGNVSTAQGYDRFTRDPRSKKFYDSAAWARARIDQLNHFPVCQHCTKSLAYAVHHVIPLAINWELRLAATNLMSICQPCHNTLHKGKK
jgi:5-methylcytosine-specific restriction protein A